MKYNKTLEGKMIARISRKKSNILLREDFNDLAGYDQVGRALQSLVQKEKLVKIGYGLYAKARVSTLTGKVMPAAPLPDLAKSALKRLGVTTGKTEAEKDYQTGRSTQVPTGRMISVDKRVSRKIGFNEASISYEFTARKTAH